MIIGSYPLSISSCLTHSLHQHKEFDYPLNDTRKGYRSRSPLRGLFPPTQWTTLSPLYSVYYQGVNDRVYLVPQLTQIRHKILFYFYKIKYKVWSYSFLWKFLYIVYQSERPNCKRFTEVNRESCLRFEVFYHIQVTKFCHDKWFRKD